MCKLHRSGTGGVRMEEERGEWYLAKQIAAGILIAAAVIFVGFHLYAAIAARVAAKAAQELVQQSQQEMQEQLERNASKRRAQVEAQRVANERRSAAELAKRQEAASQARAEQATAAAKRQAWRNFYKPSPKCADPPDWDTQVECGNAHMRAQKEFESRWARGDLR
jgi:hypothetical protein